MNRTSLEKKWIKQIERNRQKEKTDRQICTPAHCIALSGYLKLFKNSFPQIIFFRHKKKKNIQGKKKRKSQAAQTGRMADSGSSYVLSSLGNSFQQGTMVVASNIRHNACTYIQRGLMMFFPSRPATPTRLTFRCHATPSPRQRERLEKREILMAGD